MQSVNFFTPIHYGNQSKSLAQSAMEVVDEYLAFGDKKACVIAGKVEDGKQGVVLTERKSSCVLSALKVASYFMIILPLIALFIKAALRCNYQFYLIDPRRELERGVEIGDDLIAKLQDVMAKICGRKEDPRVEWMSRGTTAVFRLKEIPDLVFKTHTSETGGSFINDKVMNGKQQIQSRFENMVKAKEVCMAHSLDFLVVPQTKLFELEANGKTFPFIAEQALNIPKRQSMQEQSYRELTNTLDQPVRQLGTLIAETGFNDVVWRNIPVIEEPPESQETRRIGLIDLEHMKEAKEGILGGWRGRGLVRCLFSERHIDAVLDDAKAKGIITQTEATEVRTRRLQELLLDRQLIQFYGRKGILANPRKPIEVNLDILGLKLDQAVELSSRQFILNGTDGGVGGDFIQRITMREVTETIIAEINRSIQEAEEDESVKGKRHIVLNPHRGTFDNKNYGLISEVDDWFESIINALVKQGHIFELIKHNGHGYFIQA